jgi:hypothetical protein
VQTYAEHAKVTTRGGLRILADHVGARSPSSRTVAVGELPPAQVLDRTLGAIADRYGSDTAGIVAMQLEYPGRPAD